MSHSGVATPQTAPIDADGISSIWRGIVGTTATSDAVHATLRESIIQGLIAQGARLGEEELSALLGVSRTPIREALLRLEVEQLAVRIQRRGLEVRRITEEEIHEVYEVRRHLVILAMQLATPKITSADLARLQWLNDQLREAYALGDLRRCVALGDEFHNCLYQASGNSVLVQFLQQLRTRIRRFPGFTYQSGDRAEEIIAEHDAQIQALHAGDIEKAAAVASDHAVNAMRARVTMLGSSGEKSAREVRETE